MTREAPASLLIRRGLCSALYVYDIGLSIDLARARKGLAAQNEAGAMRQNRRAPAYFDYSPAPIRLTQEAEPLLIGGYRTSSTVDIVVYDFGAVAVSYSIPFDGPLDSLLSLSCDLRESEVLLGDSRRKAEGVLDNIRRSVFHPHIADLVEDYAVFQVDQYDTRCPADELHLNFAQDLARVLRAEKAPVSDQEVADALACRISYGKTDVTLIDWNAALVFDRDADDVRAVLEFANVELLELRFLDRHLDEWMDRSYEVLSSSPWKLIEGITGPTARLRKVGQMQVDGAILFERVSNALKLVGDQYLARVYRLASQRFHFAEWNSAILRKLDTIEDIYGQMQDRSASRRMELLEWIIIVLIAFEIVLPFLPKLVYR